MMIRTSKIIEVMWAMGMPTSDDKFANVYRAAIKAGLNDQQAFALVKDAYNAAKGYEWSLSEGHLKLAPQKRHAVEFPMGKCAEDLRAIAEGRPSRWGTPEFHRAS